MTKTETDAYPLNAEQLGLVFNLPYYGALYLFKELLTPSEVARRMQVPANVMHYRVKRLLDAGLLEVADDSSRSRTYQTVATRFLLSPELQPAVGEAVPTMLETMLSKIHRNLFKRLEEEQSSDTSFDSGPVEFELDDSLNIGAANPPAYGTCVTISTLTLSAEQFQKIYKAVNAILGEVKVEEGEKRCTLAFLAYQGEGAM